MRDMNEEPAHAGRRAIAESIEQGGGGLGVADLLAKVRATATEPAPAPAPDLAGLTATIAAAAGRHLPSGQLAPDADFFDAGGTSVGAVELAAELEGELGIEVDLDGVFADARPVSLARRWLLLLEATRPPMPSAAPAALAAAPGVSAPVAPSADPVAHGASGVFGTRAPGLAAARGRRTGGLGTRPPRPDQHLSPRRRASPRPPPLGRFRRTRGLPGRTLLGHSHPLASPAPAPGTLPIPSPAPHPPYPPPRTDPTPPTPAPARKTSTRSWPTSRSPTGSPSPTYPSRCRPAASC
ncbi:acyl carrier protein [Streptomyces diastatochromogenes]|nr:acyl carrier protein [Streptomyces diastatochromogenes]